MGNFFNYFFIREKFLINSNVFSGDMMGLFNRKSKEEKEQEETEKILSIYDVHKGVTAHVIFPEKELKIKTQDPAMKGMAAWSWGIVGLAMTSGVKTEEKNKSLKTVIQVAEKGVVIKNAQSDGRDLRIPFTNIIRATDDKMVNGKISDYLRLILLENQIIQVSLLTRSKITMKKEVKLVNKEFIDSINAKASGAQNEEAGWGLDYAENNDTEHSNNNSSSGTQELKEIMKMYQDGLLTEEEFVAMKKKIIEN